MSYDFDKSPDRRGTLSNKWDRVGELFGNPEALPMWVADTDFECPRPVMDALRGRLEHPVFGYHFPPESLLEAIVDRMWEHHGWRIEPEWIVPGTGVITALGAALETVSDVGDEIILQPPVYYPFFSSVGDSGRRVAENRLILENGRYRMDFEGLKDLCRSKTTFPAREPRVAALVLCSPHNPVGRVWSADELEELGRICLERDIALVSDEIHCDLVLGGARHTVAASISEEMSANTITLMSANKTYNLPGLKSSFSIIPDEGMRRRFALASRGGGSPNSLGLVALEAALRDADGYLGALLEYLEENLEIFREGVADLTGVRLIEPEGTYLVWLDMRDLGMDDGDLARFMVHEVGLAPDYGFAFGAGGEGFQRINLGCTRDTVREAVTRLRAALS